MKKQGFASVQIIELNHTSISIFPTIVYGSNFIPNKVQSALSASANSAWQDKCSAGQFLFARGAGRS